MQGKGIGAGSDARRRRGGFSLLEVLMASSLFTIVAGGAVYSLFTTTLLARANQETNLALDAAESALERIKGEPFPDAFRRFNAITLDDGGTPAPGNAFAVRGLDAAPDDPDGLPGEILFPGGGAVLREDVVDRDLGMPRDLDLDGRLDAVDHATDYRLLPVRVRVRWSGASGVRQIELTSNLTFD